MRKEEATARAQIVEEEQFLVLSDLAVVTFGCLNEEGFVLGELLLVGE